MHIQPLSTIIDSHSIKGHSIAVYYELQMSAPPDKIAELLLYTQSCISDINVWAAANMLKLNEKRTELMLVT